MPDGEHGLVAGLILGASITILIVLWANTGHREGVDYHAIHLALQHQKPERPQDDFLSGQHFLGAVQDAPAVAPTVPKAAPARPRPKIQPQKKGSGSPKPRRYVHKTNSIRPSPAGQSAPRPLP